MKLELNTKSVFDAAALQVIAERNTLTRETKIAASSAGLRASLREHGLPNVDPTVDLQKAMEDAEEAALILKAAQDFDKGKKDDEIAAFIHNRKVFIFIFIGCK